MRTSILYLVGALVLTSTLPTISEAQKKAQPPKAKIVPTETKRHGTVLKDPYAWMRDRENPEVIEYLESENDYMEAITSHTKGFQETLFQEMKSRIKEDDLSVPVRVDNYYYYTRNEEGKQYDIICRKKGSLQGTEEIVLDENLLAEGHEYFSLGNYAVSPNHQVVAYLVNYDGNESFALKFRDLTTGKDLHEEVPAVSYDLEWANDNKTVFYTTRDHTHRSYRVHRHVLGTDASKDVLVYEDLDLGNWVSVSKTRSQKYLLILSESSLTSEVRCVLADHPQEDFRVIQPRTENLEYYVNHHGDHFYIVTNDNAQNFKVVKAPVKSPAKANWEDYIPHRANVKIDDIDCFEKHIVVYERDQGLEKIQIRDLQSKQNQYLAFDESVYSLSGQWNPNFKTDTFRFGYQSMVTPRSIFEHNLADNSRELLKQTEVLGGYDASRYVCERIWATADDGTKIPISLLYTKGMKKTGDNPFFLYGYGSYGSSVDPSFRSTRFSMVDRGFIYAIAHIRGGGIMGRAWYEDGKFLKKKNTFTDFINCAEHVIAEGYTRKERLAIGGGSAGGLLIGAVVNMRPDLFEAAVAHVPFVDVMNTMLDESIPLTVMEYQEWGNPNDKEYFDYMRSYSPYDNVKKQAYPNMFVTAGLNDPRVGYWEASKWVAALRQAHQGDQQILFKVNMGQGHGGASGRFDRLREIAEEYSWVMDRLKVTEEIKLP